jgi:Holliday junction resolvase RusA-like endonuclease
MTNILYRAIIEDVEIIPKIRLPLKMKWSKQGKRYLEHKEQLSWMLKKHFKFIEPIDYNVSISCAIHLAHRRRVDLDNLLGYVFDSLQYAGVIKDDRQIVEVKKCNVFRDGCARLVVELRRL